MVQLDSLRHHCGAWPSSPHPLQHLMHRMNPLIAVACMGLFIPEGNPLAAVRVKGPGIAVCSLARLWQPRLLQPGPPARMKYLIQICTYADIRVFRHQLHGPVAGHIEPPGGDDLYLSQSPPGSQPLHSVVLGAGVQHHYLVRLSHRVHPAVYELSLIFTDGIYHHFHGARPPLSDKEQGGRHGVPPALFRPHWGLSVSSASGLRSRPRSESRCSLWRSG